jgi:hypothetical protein
VGNKVASGLGFLARLLGKRVLSGARDGTGLLTWAGAKKAKKRIFFSAFSFCLYLLKMVFVPQ